LLRFVSDTVYADVILHVSRIIQLPVENFRLTFWGQRISIEVAKSQHPHREIAQQQPGNWMDFFFVRFLEDYFRIQMPPIPDYYKPFLERESLFSVVIDRAKHSRRD